MKANEVMTKDVVVAGPGATIRDLAMLLLKNAISAVPVVDESGCPIGMVSEGDLISRSAAEREARRDWWLALLAEGEALDDHFLASLRSPERTAREIMSAPVVTVNETTETSEIARLLATYHIKRVPVVRAGSIVGIVSRADLLRALAADRADAAADHKVAESHGIFAAIDRRYFHREYPTAAAAAPSPAPDHAGVSADDFRDLVLDSKHDAARRNDAERQVAMESRRKTVKQLIDHHIADAGWQDILHRAREAAEHGQKEFMLMRFPHELCSDGGRAINALEPDWPRTLRGEAAEIYLRWERDLRPHGFHLVARVLEFPGGFPGDIGLFLAWAV